jgi:hypothetical protein
VAVDQLAQVVLDTQGDASGDHPPHVREQPADEHGPDDRERNEQQRVTVVVARGELMAVGMEGPSPQRVDRCSREDGQAHRHEYRGARQRPGCRQTALVRTQEAEQSVEGRHSCMDNDYRRSPAGRATGAAKVPVLTSPQWSTLSSRPPHAAPTRDCVPPALTSSSSETRGARRSPCAGARGTIRPIPVTLGCRSSPVAAMSPSSLSHPAELRGSHRRLPSTRWGAEGYPLVRALGLLRDDEVTASDERERGDCAGHRNERGDDEDA